MARSPPQRRLVHGGGEPPRRHGRQRAGVARPRHAEELAGRSAHPRHLDVPAEPRKRPVERARKPRRAGLLARERGASPDIGAIEKPHAGKPERGGDLRDLRHIRRARTGEPAPRHAVEGRHKRLGRPRKEGEAIVAQGARLYRALLRVLHRSAVTDVGDWDSLHGAGHRLIARYSAAQVNSCHLRDGLFAYRGPPVQGPEHDEHPRHRRFTLFVIGPRPANRHARAMLLCKEKALPFSRKRATRSWGHGR